MYNYKEIPGDKFIEFEVLKNVDDKAVEQYLPLDKNKDKQEYARVTIIHAVLVRLDTFLYTCSLKFPWVLFFFFLHLCKQKDNLYKRNIGLRSLTT